MIFALNLTVVQGLELGSALIKRSRLNERFPLLFRAEHEMSFARAKMGELFLLFCLYL